MDTFMDHLAEKINAQEMIKANTTAELQELDQVKGQVEELKTYATQIKAGAEQVREALEQWKESANADRPVREPGKEAAVDEDIVYIVEEEVTQLGKDLEARSASIQGSISGLEARLADVCEKLGTFASMEESRGKAEEPAERDESRVDSVAAEIRDAIGGLREETAELKERIAGTQEAISGVAEALSGMKESTAGTQEAISGVAEALSGMKESTAGTQEAISGVAEALSGMKESTAGTQEAVGGIREETAAIREEMAGIRGEVGNVREALFSELSRNAGKITEIGDRNAERSAEGMDALKNFLIGQLDQLRSEKNNDADAQELARKMEELIDKVSADGEERKKDLDEKLKGVHEGLKEGYHKECVKVYRNVQAAFTEENEKQTGKLTETVETLGGKYKLTLIFAILAFVSGLGSLVLQILSILKVLP